MEDRPLANRSTLIRMLIVSAGVIYFSQALLEQLNRFVDSTPPMEEGLTVQSVGKYYQPFRVDYLSGYSRAMNTNIRVPVLPAVAEATKIGVRAEIVIGKGLLGKPWASPRDKYNEYGDRTFRTVYVGIFALFFISCSFVYVKWSRSLRRSMALSGYVGAVAIGAVLFYLF